MEKTLSVSSGRIADMLLTSHLTGDRMKSAVAQLKRVHEVIREVTHKEIPAQHLAILYEVALNHPDGITHTQLAKVLHMPQGTVSRNVAKLAFKMEEQVEKRNFVEVGYGLVQNRQDVYDPRAFSVTLTKKGEGVVGTICTAMLRACEALK